MAKLEKFDWCDYYNLAKSYQNEKNVVKLRTGINRFYYSCFLKSRDHILKNKLYLGKNSKDIMNSKSSQVHKETRKIFENHQKLNTSKNGEKIAKELNELRYYRNIVDYDCEKPKNIKYAYDYCKARAKVIFNLLDELN